MISLFIITLTFLLLLSWLDLKYMEIDNKPILALLIIGLVFQIINHNLIPTILGMALMTLFAYTCWKKDIIGGADAKLLICLVPCLTFVGIPNMLANLLFFIMEFGIIGIMYSLIMRISFKNRKIIPFIPVIAITYVINWIFKF